MRAITKTEIKTALDEVGITNGQTIMVHSDLTRIGWVANANSRIDILELISTFAVPLTTTQCSDL